MPAGLRAALAIEAFRHTAAYDARIAAELPAGWPPRASTLPDEPGLPGADDPFPPSLTIGLEKVETLRYGENPHQPAARYRRAGATRRRRPVRDRRRAAPGQGALSYNNVLDASAAAAIARALRGPACVIVKHTNPCGAAERATLARGLGRGARRRPGLGVRRRRRAHRDRSTGATAEGLASLFLEVVVAPGVRRRRPGRSSPRSRTSA